MYNLDDKDSMKFMKKKGRVTKGIVIGLIVGFLSFMFLFSNHPELSFAAATITALYLTFMPGKKEKMMKTRIFIFPAEVPDTDVWQELPPYSLSELKGSSEDALFDRTVDDATQAAELGGTDFWIWHIGKNGLKKYGLRKKVPGSDDLGGPGVSLSNLLETIFPR